MELKREVLPSRSAEPADKIVGDIEKLEVWIKVLLPILVVVAFLDIVLRLF